MNDWILLPLVSLANLILIFLTLFYTAMFILILRHLVLFLLVVVPFCLWGQWREVSVFSISGLSSASALLPLALFLSWLFPTRCYVSVSQAYWSLPVWNPLGWFFFSSPDLPPQEPWDLPFHGNSHPHCLPPSLSYTASPSCWDSNPEDLFLYFLSGSSESNQKLW